MAPFFTKVLMELLQLEIKMDDAVLGNHIQNLVLFLCPGRLLTWRPAGQEEETADGKYFVRN